MNLTVNRHQGSYYSNPYQQGPTCCPQRNPFQGSTGLGSRRPGMGRLIGGIVGAVLGQMLCPIPFVGAMLGGLIGSMFGSMLDNVFAGSAPCCCQNMGQQYGPYNANMGMNYGYPMELPYIPQGFHNPHYGETSRPLFSEKQPPIASYGLPQIGINPVYNNQHQRHTTHTTQRSQNAVSVVGKNKQTQENHRGHNQGAQRAAVSVGVNEQRQENVHGHNQGNQTAVVQVGANRQTQSNINGSNDGKQRAFNVVGTSTQKQETVRGDNTGSQTAVKVAGNAEQKQKTSSGDNTGAQTAGTVVGSNTQKQESRFGSNVGPQTAVTTAGVNEQTQTTKSGDNWGNQRAENVAGPNTQKQESETGNNEGHQVANTAVGQQKQEKVTVTGDNTGTQSASSVVGDVTQTKKTVTGTSTGEQRASTLIGDTKQVDVAGDSNTSAQTASTGIGNTEQVATGGTSSSITQKTSSGSNSTQTAKAGESSQVEQTANTSGKSTQKASVSSGTIVQKGGNKQTANSRRGSVVVRQSGARHGDAQQSVRGSNSNDIITQKAGQGTLRLFDNNTTANADLGGGNDIYTYEGNSEMNHVRVNGGGNHSGTDRDTVRIDTKGGSDTAVINLSNGRDNYRVNLGSGNDRLVINEKGQKIRITDNRGKEIYRSKGWTSQDGTARVDGMENLSVYREDGSYAKWKKGGRLTYGRDSGDKSKMSPVKAARLLREHAGLLDKAAGNGSVDGIMGRNDLIAAYRDSKTPAELKEAIRYAINNQSVWKALDASGAGSNRVNVAGLNKFIDGYENKPGYTTGSMNTRRAAQVMNYHSSLLDTASGGGKNGKFNEDDLKAIVSSKNASLPTELRSAARLLLNSSSFKKNLDAVSWESGSVFDSQRTFSDADLRGFR